MIFDNIAQRIAMRTLCEDSQLMFTRYFHKQREEQKFISNWHHACIARAIDMVFDMQINRLLITLPPGFTKSMFLLDAMARGYAKFPMAKNMHITYNSGLANYNSQILLDTLALPDYKSFWGIELRPDVTAKRRWNTRHGGGLVASGIGGTIMGFRAGRIAPGVFTGMMTLDDLIKASDANSKLERDKTNYKLVDTLRSRLALPTTPIIMTMQRLHDNDPAGFCLRGGTGDYWHHLNIPARMTKESLKPGKEYARKYPYGIPLLFPDLMRKGWTWPLKIDAIEHAKVKAANPFVCAAQLDQHPEIIEGNFIKGKWLRFYRELPDLRYFNRLVMIVDTALERKIHNDRTVWGIWGDCSDGHAYLLDYSGDRLEVPDMEDNLLKVWNRFRNTQATGLPRVSAMHVEKKASGHGVIQKFTRIGVNVVPVERNTDKVSRAMDTIPALKTGRLLLPAKGIKTQFTSNRQQPIMVEEVMQFSADMDHAHDDYCDMLFDAADIFYNGLATFRETFGQSLVRTQ